MMVRVGQGYDVHRLVAGRRLVLGGVEIPAERGLDGHSDADVVLHAVMDAILGAAGMGDIGEHFPPSQERWRDSDSRKLLEIVHRMIDADWTILNIDVTVVAESPRIGPHRDAMRDEMARRLRLEPSQVNIKATTNERLGFIGRGEGIAAFAVVALGPHQTGETVPISRSSV